MKRIRDMKHRFSRVLARIAVTLVSVALCVALIVVIFMSFWKPLSAKASKEMQKEYATLADNYSDGEFSNPGEFSVMSSYTDPYANRAGDNGRTPADVLPSVEPQFLTSPKAEEFTVTWLGHSTLLLQIEGLNILFDPVFSDIASPVSFVGPERFSPRPIEIGELPELDAVIITHDHYDHLDYSTICALKDKTKRFVVGLGVENHLLRFGVEEAKISSLVWWQEMELGSLTVACTPARHYSGRSLNDHNATLWTSWVLRGSDIQVYVSGDTGYGDHFAEIYRRYGSFDLALLDCAQYNERWHEVHMFPEEAVRAAGELHAKTLMPIHWGAFSLSLHAWDDPAQRFTQRAEEQGFEVITPKLGQTVTWNERDAAKERWWREYK